MIRRSPEWNILLFYVIAVIIVKLESPRYAVIAKESKSDGHCSKDVCGNENIHHPVTEEILQRVAGEDYPSKSGTQLPVIPPLKTNIVVYSTDSGANYLFFTPITALLWKVLSDYQPFIFVVFPDDTYQTNPLYQFVLNETKKVGGLVYLIVNNNQNSGKPSKHSDATIAQVSRLYPHLVDFHRLWNSSFTGDQNSNDEDNTKNNNQNKNTEDDIYILTSDVDMFPLDGKYFSQRNKSKKVQLYTANQYQHLLKTKNQVMYPICYIGATKRIWKEIMEGDSLPTSTPLSVEDAVVQQLDQAVLEYGEPEWNKQTYGKYRYTISPHSTSF